MSRAGWVRRQSVFWRVFLVDVVVLGVATVLLTVTPITISAPVELDQLAVLLAGLATMLLSALVLLHRTLRPLKTLTERCVGSTRMSPGRAGGRRGAGADVAALRTPSTTCSPGSRPNGARARAQALSVQEAERRRVARELHDEVGQIFTAISCRSRASQRRFRRRCGTISRSCARPPARAPRTCDGSPQRLRPEALEELGLQSALSR